MTQVAIVILNYNTQKFLAEFLPSVCATQYSNLKIVVADNASKDDSVNYVKQNFPQIEVIVLEKNYGFTGGYNRALKQVTADYYVLLNSDVKVDPNWIQPMVDLVEKNPMIAINGHGKISKAETSKNIDKFRYNYREISIKMR